MHLRALRVKDLRCVAQAELSLAPGINVILGANGAGKTTLLEAVHLVARGRSFRTRQAEVLVRRGTAGFAIFLEVERRSGIHRLGLGRTGGQWQVRIDEGDAGSLSALFARCAACCFEPGSHELLTGVREERRAFIDWGVFHMEPAFASTWRRYQRALRQRNAALKSQAGERELDAWDCELVDAGEALAQQRARYLQQFEPVWAAAAAEWLPELGPGRLRISRGWPEGLRLSEALAASRGRDRARLSTGQGPHRFDWEPSFAAAAGVAELSRGQAKMTALATVLAQAALYEAQRGEAAILLLDDLPSELDQPHQARLLATIQSRPNQVLVTATEPGPVMAEILRGGRVFHVEHGRVHPASAG